ncbi:MAG: zinc-dependent peptidase, partial [Desulfobulbales bacterium]
MKLFILLMVVGFSVWAWFFIKGFRRQQKRRLLLSSPFSPAWDAILKKNLPPYGNLPPDLLQQLQDVTRIFMAEKSFEGCGGLTLTDEIKVTIAAQACMLLLNRKVQYYP